MRIEFLGTGGALTTPRPGCACRVCVEARTKKGVPYTRTGPSLFVHGPDVLIDTPEEINYQLNRSQIDQIGACFYSHWHPDHMMGRRVWEALNYDWRNWPPRHRQTPIYLPEQVGKDFRTRLGTWEHLTYLEGNGLIRIVELSDGESVELNGVIVTPFRLAEDYVYAFLFEQDGKRVMIAPDELHNWDPPVWVRGLDLAVLPMGVVEFDPFSRQRHIHQDHVVLTFEATFDQTLGIAAALDADRIVLTHIEEMDGLSYDDLLRLEKEIQAGGLNLVFAYDTMVVEI